MNVKAVRHCNQREKKSKHYKGKTVDKMKWRKLTFVDPLPTPLCLVVVFQAARIKPDVTVKKKRKIVKE